MNTRRKTLSKTVEHQIREECGQACANPTCRAWSTSTHEIHHIDGDRSNSSNKNLILLCANCHSKQQSGIISEADIMMWKLMAQSHSLPPPKGEPSANTMLIRDNFGVAGQVVNIEKLQMSKPEKSKRREITPGLIEANPDMRTYADYLVKRYIAWRKKGQYIDKRRFSSGSAHGILGEGFGSPSSVFLIPQPRFFDWVAQAQAKIDLTVWGKGNLKKGSRNYHTWEEHLMERQGAKGS